MRLFSGAMQGNGLPKEAIVRENTPRIQIHHRRTKLHSVSSHPPHPRIAQEEKQTWSK